MAHAQHVLIRAEPNALAHSARYRVRKVRPVGPLRQPVLVHVHRRPSHYGEHPTIRHVHRSDRSVRRVRVEGLEGANVPHFELPVTTGRCHVPPPSVDRDVRHCSLVAEHLHNGLVQVGRPHGHHARVVSERDDSVPRVESHAVAPAEPRRDLHHVRTCRHVEVAQASCRAHRRQQPMVAEEGQPVDVGLVVTQAVQLRPSPIVHVQVLVLRHCEHRVVAQEGQVADRLSQLQLVQHVGGVGVDDGDVALLAAQ
mmetsp:Transcript_17003/g.28972  ORF Transcript_17003/g.28972 Transcript_17003/m.28972 type:complete len:254 (+) Transcript_17003:628-1389(+)